tara:strand:- start:331 stop:627 length:297 start_codon:yes stop_codon:yes gene_type:complete
MKTLIKANEFGKVSKSFYNNIESATNGAGSFLNDCTVNKLDRNKRTVEIIDFEFEKYGFDSMPLFVNYKITNLGIYLTGIFKGWSQKHYTYTALITNL